jgi:uncharacterized membrane protein
MTETSQNTPQSAPEPFGIGEPAGAPISDNDKLLAGLSYVSQFLVPLVLPLVLLLGEDSKRSPFIRHHAVQSLALVVAAVAWEVAAVVVNAVAACLACILWVLFLAPIVPFIYYGVLAFQGKYVEIPYLTKFLKQNKWL